jgi:hypothetical protein
MLTQIVEPSFVSRQHRKPCPEPGTDAIAALAISKVLSHATPIAGSATIKVYKLQGTSGLFAESI